MGESSSKTISQTVLGPHSQPDNGLIVVRAPLRGARVLIRLCCLGTSWPNRLVLPAPPLSRGSAVSLGPFHVGQAAPPIFVNRAPVLTLWATVVAERLGYSPETALTLGRFVAGSSARAKGLSLGNRIGRKESGWW